MAGRCPPCALSSSGAAFAEALPAPCCMHGVWASLCVHRLETIAGTAADIAPA